MNRRQFDQHNDVSLSVSTQMKSGLVTHIAGAVENFQNFEIYFFKNRKIIKQSEFSKKSKIFHLLEVLNNRFPSFKHGLDTVKHVLDTPFQKWTPSRPSVSLVTESFGFSGLLL